MTLKCIIRWPTFNKIYCTLKCIKMMSTSSNNALKLHERGMYQDVFPADSNQEILDILNSKPQCVYSGFDPTASSLHIGNLLVLINLLHWQRAGHHVVALVGGATGYIGDPSGRNCERPVLKKAVLSDNVTSIEKSIKKIFSNHEQFLWKDHSTRTALKPLKIVNNHTWYSNVNAVEFVSHIGRHFRMGTMLSRQSAQKRMNSGFGMSFAEFCYQIFQAYDWLYLFQNHNCRFQVGGSDQMGNIMSGQELISRTANVAVYGLTLPLITTVSGDKFGKSAGNAVWLNAEKTSPFELYQYFLRTQDADVERFLQLFTFENLDSIKHIMKKHREKPENQYAQKMLADQVTLLVHGEEGLQLAHHTTLVLYSKNIEILGKLTPQEISQMFKGAAVREILLQPGLTTLQLALQASCFPTEGDAKRIMQAGGFYINNQRVTNIDEILIYGTHILPNNLTLVRVGKKNYYVIKWLT